MEVTNEGQYIVWKGYGLRLYIPPNSLPEDLKQCNIKITVALSGNFQLPEDSILVSAVYSFSHDLGDKELRRLVTLEMQHCTNTSALDDLCVVRSVDALSKFRFFSGANFNCSDGYGSINLHHFCCFGIVLKCFVPSNYCAKIYYTSISYLQFKLELYIIRDLDTLEKVCDVIVVFICNDLSHFYRLLKRI